MLSSREVEGNGPTKPGNPLAQCEKGANSGGAFREMRGMSRNAIPLKCRGFFVPSILILSLQTLFMPFESISHRMTIHSYVCTITFGEEGASF
jgi:hypothetical protein